MSQSDAPRTIYLKTVAGRKCPIKSPVTMQKLMDIAVEQLHFTRESIKLFVGGRLLSSRRGDSAESERLIAEHIAAGGDILVTGRPAIDKKKQKINAHKETAQITTKETVMPKRPLLTPAVHAAGDDGTSIHVGPNDKGLYRFLKPLVFMLGRRGLRHLFLLAKGQLGHFPESFQDHPVMVCIVEYVDRDPRRLKEVLTTIQEEEPELLKWIETNSELFLNVINSPPQWRDDTSPMWLIRHAKNVYGMEAAKAMGKSGAVSTVKTSYEHSEGLLDEIDDMETLLREEESPMDMYSSLSSSSSSSTSLDSSLVESSEEETSSTAMTGSTGKNTCQEDETMIDPMMQELQMIYRTWELTKERRRLSVEKSADSNDLKSELSDRLRDVHKALLRTMESYLMNPPNVASLRKLFLIGQQSWSEGEQCFIEEEENNISNAFTAALGRLLFNTGKELITSHITARQQQKKKVLSNGQTPVMDELQPFPALDPTIRWITADGPNTLLHQLREYSLKQSVSIIMYSRISSNQAYAYVVRDGDVKGASILSDESAGRELKELERLYDVISQTHPPKDAIKIRRVIRTRWISLLEKFYRRLLSPIEKFLPRPATKLHVPPAEVGQICFIDAFSPSHIPIPFHALINSNDGASCLLQWAVFRANRPWDLISSAEIPWSSFLAKSPVITRLMTPDTIRPTMTLSEGFFRSGAHMVTYVNTTDDECVSIVNPTHNETSKKDNNVERGGLWRNIPWEHWLEKVLGTVHAGIPTFAFVNGKHQSQKGTTALFIHETLTTERESIKSTESSSTMSSSSIFSFLNGTNKNLSILRGMPYNQSSDLFVSHLVGRDSGAGIHRAALLPVFKVAGRDPAETYTSFLKTLVATNDMTAAKAYRLTMLLSWQSECKEEPWRSASIMLFNYGGTMKTLGSLHEEYCKKRYLKAPRFLTRNREATPNEGTENQQQTSKSLRNPPCIRATVDGSYVDKHGIDIIYDVVLHELSASRPQGEIAILDNMIQCIERNRSTLEECVERNNEKKRAAQKLDTSPPVESVSAPSSHSDGGASFVSAMRNMITENRNSGSNTGPNGMPSRELRPPKGNQPPNGRRPPKPDK